MSAGSSRVGLAAVVALASTAVVAFLLAVSPAATAGGTATLPPDLVTVGLEPEDLLVSFEKERMLLRFSNEVANDGTGPLEVAPSAASSGCDGDADPDNDRDASQRLYGDTDASGGFSAHDEIEAKRRFGCMRYHLAHNHWHTLNFASYELRRERSGRLIAARRKVGFCVVDTQRPFPGPTSPATPVYPYGAASGQGCDAVAVQGLSVGWSDLYALGLPGQQLNIHRLRSGRFCLISRADPRDLIAEGDETNNVMRTRLALKPRQFSVKALPGACKL